MSIDSYGTYVSNSGARVSMHLCIYSMAMVSTAMMTMYLLTYVPIVSS